MKLLILVLMVVVTAFAPGCADPVPDDGDNRPAEVGLGGGDPIGGGGDIRPAELATVDPRPADFVVDTGRVTPQADDDRHILPQVGDDTLDGSTSALAGAERIGGGGTTHPNVAPLELKVQDAMIDDLDLHDATAVAVDGAGGTWVLVQRGARSAAGGDRATALRAQGDRVDVARSIPAGSQAWLLTAEAGGEVVVGTFTLGEIAEERGVGELTDLNLLAADPADDRAIRVAREDLAQVGALALATNGSLVAGRDDRTRIDVIAPDGDVHHLVGFAGFDPDADVQLDEPLGEVLSLVALPDGRVAFVTRHRGENALRLLDGDGVRTIGTTPQDRSREIRTITAGPDGQLLAVAAGPETHPQIWVIDVDTGEAQVVADLEGVLQHPDGPRGIPGALWSVAAAADGEDLVFLADGFLWRRPDAFE